MPRRRTARAFVIWLLVLALPLCASSGLVTQMLGPAHVHLAAPHRSASAGAWAMAWQAVQDAVRDARMRAHAQAHLLGMGHHSHPHGGLQRHWHAPGDATVVALGDDTHDAAASSEAPAGAPAFPLAWGPGFAPSPVARTREPWMCASTPVWRNADPVRYERPPQA